MKKNWTMRVGVVLVALTLITSCFVGSTFAKYVTSGTGTDSARVAKWGVTVTAAGTTFAKEYATDDVDVKGTITNSVVSTENVVAPGTGGNMVSVALSGTPEVAVEVTYSADLALSSNWTVDGAYYCPIKITVNGTTLSGTDYTSAADFETAVEGLIASVSKQYEANKNLATVGADAISITWEWPFSTGDANDIKDTWLGGQAAASNAATISLTVTTTVTQID